MIARWPIYGVVTLWFDDTSFKMYSKGDDNIVQLLYYNKNYHEGKDLRLFLQLAKKADVIFDIGANTGLYSILSHIVNPSVKLFSFEPYPVNVKRLKRNLELNSTKTEIVEKALGGKRGIISFAVPANDSIADTSSAEIDFSKSTYKGKIDWKTIEVEQTTLNAFAADKNFDKVDLLKIDVEGYEESVFEGAGDFFKKYRPVIQCEILLDERRKRFFENFLKENKYTAYLILNDGIMNVGKQMFPNPGSVNYLFSGIDTMKPFHPYSEIVALAEELLGENNDLNLTPASIVV